MSFDDEDSGPSLKELMTKNLEANGTLGKLQVSFSFTALPLFIMIIYEFI